MAKVKKKRGGFDDMASNKYVEGGGEWPVAKGECVIIVVEYCCYKLHLGSIELPTLYGLLQYQ